MNLRWCVIILLTLVQQLSAANPSEDFQGGFQSGWKTFWGSHEYKNGKAVLRTKRGKTHMGFNKKLTFDPKRYPTLEIETVGGSGGWRLIIKPDDGKGPVIASGKGPGKVRVANWYEKLKDPKEQKYEFLLSVGGDIVVDRITFLDVNGNPPPGHNQNEKPFQTAGAGFDDDPDGTKKAAADSAKREAERGGPDYSIANEQSSMYPAVPQLHKAGVDESVFTNGKGVVLNVTDVATLKSAWQTMKQKLAAGTPVKIKIAPGTYRLRNALELMDIDKRTADTPLVIEGSKGAILSGSRMMPASGYKAVDGQPGLYVGAWRHSWTMYDPGRWGTKDALAQRREVLVIDGKLMQQRLIQEYKYDKKRKWIATVRNQPGTLQAGQFAIDDEAKKLYFRLPAGKSLNAQTTIEIPEALRLIEMNGKSNLVVRGLTFQHTIGIKQASGPLDINDWGPAYISRNVLIENCLFQQNNMYGVSLDWMEDTVLKNVIGRENGHAGLRVYHSQRVRIEDCVATKNGFRNGNGAGVNPSGRSLYLLRVKSTENYGRGLRQDHILNGALLEDCEFSRNTVDGVFFEISVGPVTLKDCTLKNNGAHGLRLLAVDHFTLDGCKLINNKEHQIYFEGGNRTYNDAFTPGKFKRDEPSLPGYTDYTIINSVIAAEQSGSLLVGRPWKADKGKSQGNHKKYVMWYKDEIKASNNQYWHETNQKPFEISTGFFKQKFTDFAGWKKATGTDQDSRWEKPKQQ